MLVELDQRNNFISFLDLILKPFRTDDFVAKLYFETSRFTALQYQWQVRARINDNNPHPHTTITRSLTYQLVLKSKVSQPIDLKFFILKGPHGDPSTVQIQPIIYHFEFNQNSTETEYLKLPITSQECNRILSSSSISFRLLMVQLDRPQNEQHSSMVSFFYMYNTMKVLFFFFLLSKWILKIFLFVLYTASSLEDIYVIILEIYMKIRMNQSLGQKILFF